MPCLLLLMADSAPHSAHASLMRAASSGDRQAMRQVLELVAPCVLSTVRRMLGAPHPDVEDLAQEALMGVMRALPTFQGDSPLHLARQIATRRAIDGVRAAMRARRNASTLEEAEEAVSGAPSLAERQRQTWRELLADLPEAQAEVLALRAVEGYSVEEIAEMTAAPLESVRSRLRLAKATLRERIEREPALADLREEHDP